MQARVLLSCLHAAFDADHESDLIFFISFKFSKRKTRNNHKVLTCTTNRTLEKTSALLISIPIFILNDIIFEFLI